MVFKGALENSGRAFLCGQRRMLVTAIIGYPLFYFLRKNLSLAMTGTTAVNVAVRPSSRPA